MPITPDRLSRLRKFGLSEYAARAYLALLDLGVAEARDVSTLSKVPQAKIYHVLEQLHDKGLATILPEFPKKYAPVPFVDFINRIHAQHTDAADAIDRDREVLEDIFRVVGETDVGDRGLFTIVRGRRNVIAKVQEMLAEARNDVLMMGTSGFALSYPHYVPDLKSAIKRGAKIRVLAPLTSDTIPRLAPLSELGDVRARNLTEGSHSSSVAILAIDKRRAFLINFLPDDDNLYTGRDIGVFTDHEAMVRALEALVESQWAIADSIQTLSGPIGALSPSMRPGAVGIGRLFDIVRDAVLVIADDGRIVLANPAAREAFGLVEGQLATTIIPEADRLLAPGGNPAEVIPTRAQRPGGPLVDVEATVAAVIDAHGRAYSVFTLREANGRTTTVDVKVQSELTKSRAR